MDKTRILAIYYILVNSGATVSESLKRLVEKIQNDSVAERVARA